MNYLLKNGDAHLKNFGTLYDSDCKSIYFAPAYDVVNTTVYFYKDRPALSMRGKKLWFAKKELVHFGKESCYLSHSEAESIYDKYIESLKSTIVEVQAYAQTHNSFEKIGKRLCQSWQLSLSEQTHKELADELTRHWN